MRVAIVASTSGSVYRFASRVPFVREQIALVVSDRECGALAAARQLGHPTVILPHAGGLAFSDALRELADAQGIDLIVSFYTRLFHGPLLDAYEGRLINFHPSILPACPGRDGFGDTIRAGTRFIGSTVHLVDTGMDTGRPLIQASAPNDPALPLAERRHRVFVQQCRSLVQVIRWYADGRVRLDAQGVNVADTRFDLAEFVPNLDCIEAIAFDAPFPG
ncbi:phosphoribosylglycinamide formyltransferase [Ancylobacter amanitiformis]|uniref:phosphoribosylglycinamide formyltransferase 1 n=1 Tax=Ancylobacter amanitiformis TaxID=217069 RepID=A0ABU0LW16_9HYPH|nr:formyltransferase family protein [Ancylobacter amanitiformis]MDQ0512868.1 phosphoribosylglycinamide formyltransferase-1 [Ancylobacter amanitiformis]